MITTIKTDLDLCTLAEIAADLFSVLFDSNDCDRVVNRQIDIDNKYFQITGSFELRRYLSGIPAYIDVYESDFTCGIYDELNNEQLYTLEQSEIDTILSEMSQLL